jgi:AcrR family transcriptional regulator
MASKAGRKAGPKADRTADRADPSDRIVDAAFKLIAERGWRPLGLADIAGAAGLTLAQLYRLYRSKSAILAAFRRRIDGAVLAGLDPADRAEGPRDRLFDVLMRRFDALRPHRAALAVLWRECPGDPLAALAGACALAGSMAWMLEAAGISAAGPLGRLRAQGLAAIWLATMPAWLKDDSEDQARTMAALDRNLSRAENLLRSLSCWPLGRKNADPAAA